MYVIYIYIWDTYLRVCVYVEFLACIIFSGSLPWIVKFNESEGRPSAIFQVNESNFTKLVEKILDVFCTDVGWQISHIYSTLVSTAVRHNIYFLAVLREYGVRINTKKEFLRSNVIAERSKISSYSSARLEKQTRWRHRVVAWSTQINMRSVKFPNTFGHWN